MRQKRSHSYDKNDWNYLTYQNSPRFFQTVMHTLSISVFFISCVHVNCNSFEILYPFTSFLPNVTFFWYLLIFICTLEHNCVVMMNAWWALQSINQSISPGPGVVLDGQQVASLKRGKRVGSASVWSDPIYAGNRMLEKLAVAPST